MGVVCGLHTTIENALEFNRLFTLQKQEPSVPTTAQAT